MMALLVRNRSGAVVAIVAIVAIVACWSMVGSAQTPAVSTAPPRFRWTAPEECPKIAEFVESVERLLERKWADADSDVEVDARVSRSEKDWRLRLEIARRASPGRIRVIGGESCRALLEAAASIVALFVDGEAPAQDSVESEVAVAGSPAATLPATPVSLSPSAPTIASSPRPPGAVVAMEHPIESAASSRTRIVVQSALLLDFGSLPIASPGARIGGGIDFRDWQVTVDGLGLLSGAASLREGASSRWRLLVAQARGCRRFSLGASSLLACSVFEGGWIRGWTNGVAVDSSGGAPWWSVGPEARFLIPSSGRLRLELGGAIHFPLRRDRFVLEGTGQVAHEIPTVALRGILGLGVLFW